MTWKPFLSENFVFRIQAWITDWQRKTCHKIVIGFCTLEIQVIGWVYISEARCTKSINEMKHFKIPALMGLSDGFVKLG